MGINSEIIRGHDLLCVERFQDATKHMIIFDIRARNSEYGEKGQNGQQKDTRTEKTI